MTELFANRISCPSLSGAQSKATDLRPPKPARVSVRSFGAMSRVTLQVAACVLVAALLLPRISAAQQAETNSPAQVFAGALARVAAIFQPPTNEPAQTFTTIVKILKADDKIADVQVAPLD